MRIELSKVVVVFFVGVLAAQASSDTFDSNEYLKADGSLPRGVRGTLVDYQRLEKDGVFRDQMKDFFRDSLAAYTDKLQVATEPISAIQDRVNDFDSASSVTRALERTKKEMEEIIGKIKLLGKTTVVPAVNKLAEVVGKEKFTEFLMKNGADLPKVKEISAKEEKIKANEAAIKELNTKLGSTLALDERVNALVNTNTQNKAKIEENKKNVEKFNLNLAQLERLKQERDANPECEATPRVDMSVECTPANEKHEIIENISKIEQENVELNKKILSEEDLKKIKVLTPEQLKAEIDQIDPLHVQSARYTQMESTHSEIAAKKSENEQLKAEVEKLKSSDLLAGVIDLSKPASVKAAKDLIAVAEADDLITKNPAAGQALEALKKAIEKVEAEGTSMMSEKNKYMAKLNESVTSSTDVKDKRAAEAKRRENRAEFASELRRLSLEKDKIQRQFDAIEAITKEMGHLDRYEGNLKSAEDIVDDVLLNSEDGRYAHYRSKKAKDKELTDMLKGVKGIDENCLHGNVSDDDVDSIQDENIKRIVKGLVGDNTNLAKAIAQLATGMQAIEARLNLNEQKEALIASQLEAQFGAEAMWKGSGATDAERRAKLSTDKNNFQMMAQSAALTAQQDEMNCKTATDAANANATQAQSNLVGPPAPGQKDQKTVDPALASAATAACNKAQQSAQAARIAASNMLKVDAALSWGAAHPEAAPGKVDPNQVNAQIADMNAKTQAVRSAESNSGNGGLTINPSGGSLGGGSISRAFGGRGRGTSRFTRDDRGYRSDRSFRSSDRRGGSRFSTRSGRSSRRSPTSQGRAARSFR